MRQESAAVARPGASVCPGRNGGIASAATCNALLCAVWRPGRCRRPPGARGGSAAGGIKWQAPGRGGNNGNGLMAGGNGGARSASANRARWYLGTRQQVSGALSWLHARAAQARRPAIRPTGRPVRPQPRATCARPRPPGCTLLSHFLCTRWAAASVLGKDRRNAHAQCCGAHGAQPQDQEQREERRPRRAPKGGWLCPTQGGGGGGRARPMPQGHQSAVGVA